VGGAAKSPVEDAKRGGQSSGQQSRVTAQSRVFRACAVNMAGAGLLAAADRGEHGDLFPVRQNIVGLLPARLHEDLLDLSDGHAERGYQVAQLAAIWKFHGKALAESKTGWLKPPEHRVESNCDVDHDGEVYGERRPEAGWPWSPPRQLDFYILS
jgi:hypothetical protein